MPKNGKHRFKEAVSLESWTDSACMEFRLFGMVLAGKIETTMKFIAEFNPSLTNKQIKVLLKEEYLRRAALCYALELALGRATSADRHARSLADELKTKGLVTNANAPSLRQLVRLRAIEIGKCKPFKTLAAHLAQSPGGNTP